MFGPGSAGMSMLTLSLRLFERTECTPVRPPLLHDVAISPQIVMCLRLALSSDVLWLMFVVCVVRNETQVHTLRESPKRRWK